MAKPKLANQTSNPSEARLELSSEEEALATQTMRSSIEVKEAIVSTGISQIVNMGRLIAEGIARGKKVVLFGNGGSAADAEHFAAELVGRFRRDREPLKALALTANSSLLTAIGNDFGFEEIFSRQVRAHVDEGDIVVGISTSGRSKNVVKGIEEARSLGAVTIALTGQNGRDLATVCDHVVTVPSEDVQRIQECHIAIVHIVCDLVERRLAKRN